MSDLVAFLRARLDEDQLIADNANTSPEMVTGIPRSYAEAPVAIHITHWHPERVLAEVTARRGIIDVHVDRGECTRCEWFSGEFYPCATLKLLGSVYAGHQDYREEWTP